MKPAWATRKTPSQTKATDKKVAVVHFPLLRFRNPKTSNICPAKPWKGTGSGAFMLDKLLLELEAPMGERVILFLTFESYSMLQLPYTKDV